MMKALQKESILSVDTEFMRTDSYFSRLCLLQLCGESTPVFVVDTVALPRQDVVDLVIIPLFYEGKNILKIIHACSQDLEVLHQYSRCPDGLIGPIFDTAIAWEFLSSSQGGSYQSLVRHYLNIEVDKSASRSDWASRPLQDYQLRYAALDVFYLISVYKKMHEQLENLGRLAWAQEQFIECIHTYCKPLALMDGIKHVKKTSACQTDKQKHKLYLMAAWREHLSAEFDSPRRWTLTDQQVVQLALQAAYLDKKEKVEGEEESPYTLYFDNFHHWSPLRDLSDGSLSQRYCEFVQKDPVPPYKDFLAQSKKPPAVTPKSTKNIPKTKVWWKMRDQAFKQILDRVKERAIEQNISPRHLLAKEDLSLYFGEDPVVVQKLEVEEPRASLLRDILPFAKQVYEKAIEDTIALEKEQTSSK